MVKEEAGDSNAILLSLGHSAGRDGKVEDHQVG